LGVGVDAHHLRGGDDDLIVIRPADLMSWAAAIARVADVVRTSIVLISHAVAVRVQLGLRTAVRCHPTTPGEPCDRRALVLPVLHAVVVEVEVELRAAHSGLVTLRPRRSWILRASV